MRDVHKVRRPIISGLLFAAGALYLGTIVAFMVKEWLDVETLVKNGGLPYFVCFALLGASVTALALYSIYLMLRGWSMRRMLNAARICVWFCALTSIVTSVWFIIHTDLFHQFGFFGIVFALACAFWMNGMYKLYINEIGTA